MDFAHLVLLPQRLLALLHFPLFFVDHLLDSVVLALVVRLLVALLRLLFVFLGQILRVPVFGRPVLNVEFVFLLERAVALASQEVALAEDVSERILGLLLVGQPDLALVVVDVVLDLLFLLLAILVGFVAFLLVLLACLLLLFFLYPLFLLFIKFLLHFSSSLKQFGLIGCSFLRFCAYI